jgi:hypothetical protein
MPYLVRSARGPGCSGVKLRDGTVIGQEWKEVEFLCELDTTDSLIEWKEIEPELEPAPPVEAAEIPVIVEATVPGIERPSRKRRRKVRP